MNDLTRAMLDDILPRGDAWTPEEQADFDLLLDGMADNYEVLRSFLSVLSDIRRPLVTPILSDLEKEYGIPTSTLLSEAERRQRLDELVYGGDSDGTEDDMQTALRNAGFDVFVYQNDPAVDPAIFLEQQFQMVAGGDNAFAGRADAFAGLSGGELLVNGDVFKTSKVFTSGAGSGLYAGTGHGAGEYEELLVEKIEYPIPTDPVDWPLVYFVGGVATLGFIELLINGGFETGDFTGWTQNSAVIDNVNPASGTWCSKLVAVGPKIIGAETVSYDIDPSMTYTVKIKNNVTAYTDGSYKNILDFYDEDDIFISEIILLDQRMTTTGYEQVEKAIGHLGTFAIPPKATSIKIKHIAEEGTPIFTAFMDDVEFFRSDKQSITEIANAIIPGTREDEFKRTILKYGPLHAWAALVVNFA